MAIGFTINQERGTPGFLNVSRSDLESEATVELLAEDDGATTYQFFFLWIPLDDGNAISSLQQDPENNRLWTFTPYTLGGESYRILLVQDKDTSTEKSIILTATIRTKNLHLAIPALNERASPDATLETGPSLIDKSERNEPYPSENFTLYAGSYAGWHTTMVELVKMVEQTTRLNHEIPLVVGNKLVDTAVSTALTIIRLDPLNYPVVNPGPGVYAHERVLVHPAIMYLEAVVSTNNGAMLQLDFINTTTGQPSMSITRQDESIVFSETAAEYTIDSPQIYALYARLVEEPTEGQFATVHSATLRLVFQSALPKQQVIT